VFTTSRSRTGIHPAQDVGDVRVLEAAEDVDDGVHLPDVGQELVPQALPLRCPLHEPGDVHELHHGGKPGPGLHQLEDPVQTRVRDLHGPHVGFHRAEGIVLGGAPWAVRALKREDFPTLGSPTIPALSMEDGGEGKRKRARPGPGTPDRQS
jgi:hypothetical protein